MKYVISNLFVLNPAEDGKVPVMQANILAAIMSGSTFQGIYSDGRALMAQPSGKQWFIPPEGMTDEEREAEEMESHIPLMDNYFMQALMNKYPMVINPVVSRNNYLLGWWRVDSVTMINSAKDDDDFRSGIVSGINEPVSTESPALYLAVAQNAFMQAGLGKKAVMYYGLSEEEPVLLFLSDSSIERMRSNQVASAFTVDVPELTKYAFNPEMAVLDANYTEALTIARRRLLVQKSDLL